MTDTMTPDQLRVEIAIKKGWTDITNHLDIAGGKPATIFEKDDDVYFINPQYLSDHVLPDWPGSIAAAWELVEDAIKQGAGFDIVTIHDGAKVWFCASFYDFPAGPKSKTYSAEADTAPMAICPAWLKLQEAR